MIFSSGHALTIWSSLFSIGQFTEHAVPIRTQELYKSHCDGLGGPLHDHIATTYGIVSNSILNSCRYFHVTVGLVPDIMHDILEGSLELCMRHLLIHLISEERLFSVTLLNSRISSFNYGPSEVKNKPTALTSASIAQDAHLKQSGVLLLISSKLYAGIPVNPLWQLHLQV